MADTNYDMETALKERQQLLYVYWLKERMSKRKNKDGTPVYQDFLNKLEKWDKEQMNVVRQ